MANCIKYLHLFTFSLQIKHSANLNSCVRTTLHSKCVCSVLPHLKHIPVPEVCMPTLSCPNSGHSDKTCPDFLRNQIYIFKQINIHIYHFFIPALKTYFLLFASKSLFCSSPLFQHSHFHFTFGYTLNNKIIYAITEI